MPDVKIQFSAETQKARANLNALDSLFERVVKRVDAASTGIFKLATNTERASGKAVAALSKWDAAARRAAESSSKVGTGLKLTNKGGSGGAFAGAISGGGGGGAFGQIGALAGKLGPLGIAGAGAFAAGAALGVLEGAGKVIANYKEQDEALKLLKGTVTDVGGSYAQTSKDVASLGETLSLGTAEAYKAETAALSLAAALGKSADTAKYAVADAADALAGMGKSASEIPSLLGKVKSGGDIFEDIGRTDIGGKKVNSNDQLYKAYAESVLNVRRELTELEKVEARRFALTSAATENAGAYEKSLKTVSTQASLLGQKIEDGFAAFLDAADHSTLLTGALEGLNVAFDMLANTGISALGGGLADALILANPLLLVLTQIADLKDQIAGVTPADRAAQAAAKKQNEIDQAVEREKRRHARELDIKNRMDRLVTSDIAWNVGLADRQGRYAQRDPFVSAPRGARLIGGADQSRESMLEALADDPTTDPAIRAAIAARKSKLDAGKYGLAAAARSNISGAQGIYGNILSTKMELARLGLAPEKPGQDGRYGSQEVTDERGISTRFAKGRYGQVTDQILFRGEAAETISADKQFDEIIKSSEELSGYFDKVIANAPTDVRGQLASEAELARLSGLKAQLGNLDASKLDAGRLAQLKTVMEDYQKAQTEQLVRQLELQIQMAKDLERLRRKLVDEDTDIAAVTRITLEDRTTATVKVVQPTVINNGNGLSNIY